MRKDRQPTRKVNFSALDARTARELLTKYGREIDIITSQYRRLYRLNYADEDELRSAAALAVLEGHLSFDGRGHARGWIVQTVRWRLRETFAAMQRPNETLAPDLERLNGADPEQQFWRATAVRAIGRLDLRHRAIVDGRMRGETFEEIGASIGLSPQMTHRESERAFAILREVLDIEAPGKKPVKLG